MGKRVYVAGPYSLTSNQISWVNKIADALGQANAGEKLGDVLAK